MRETQKKIKALRVSAGMSQQELAAATGMQQQNIGRIEAAKVGVNLDIFERILGALHHHIEIVPDATAIDAQHPETTDKKADATRS
ncbi:MAG: helix-turn-helix transcriptional regulator [Bacteroidales bacterium]|nr:helix-turn-helix transcriptional regulator [Bacteroidales bacterium]